MADSSRPTRAAPVLNATEARQGRYGRHMLWVLLGGLVLVVVAFAILWAAKAPGFAGANSNNGPGNANSTSPALPTPAFHAPEPAAQNPQPNSDHTSPGA